MIKQRYWWFIMYPDSMPKDAFQRLNDLMLPMAISPLHDRDVDYETGEQKKPHYHVLVCYSGPTTYKAVSEAIVDLVNGSALKIALYIKSAYEYLWHKNDQDKAQYDPKDIKHLHGLSYKEIDKLDFESQLFGIMLDLINQNNIKSFRSLVEHVARTHNCDLMHHLMQYSYFWRSYVIE